MNDFPITDEGGESAYELALAVLRDYALLLAGVLLGAAIMAIGISAGAGIF